MADGGTTRYRRIVRADNLDRLTEEGFEALLDHGIQNIIDLREEVEVSRVTRTPALARWHGVRLTRTHLLHELTVRERNVLATSRDTVETYRWILKHCKAGIARTFRELGAASNAGVVVHCHAGRDRTGIIAALILTLCGVSSLDIAEDYALSARELAGVYAEIAKRTPSAADRAALAAENRSNASDLLAVLAILNEEIGGVRRYLKTAGLSNEEIDSSAALLTRE
jgi:protein-tyrosine phosphatase